MRNVIEYSASTAARIVMIALECDRNEAEAVLAYGDPTIELTTGCHTLREGDILVLNDDGLALLATEETQ